MAAGPSKCKDTDFFKVYSEGTYVVKGKKEGSYSLREINKELLFGFWRWGSGDPDFERVGDKYLGEPLLPGEFLA